MNIRTLTMTKTRIVTLGLTLALLGGTVYAAVTVILAVGTIPETDLFAGPATVTVRTLTINPGEVLPWHYHPGYAFNVVRSGVLTVEEGCGGDAVNLNPGEGFEELEGHVHRARNNGTVPTVVYNTFVMPQGQPTTVNIPNNEQRCGPPSTADDCKLDGWMNFNHPEPFENQGACIKWVNHRPRTTIPLPY